MLAHDSKGAMNPDDAINLHVDSREVGFAAGAYNDIPKFLQTLPGVAFDTEARNIDLINGGNAMENLNQKPRTLCCRQELQSAC